MKLKVLLITVLMIWFTKYPLSVNTSEIRNTKEFFLLVVVSSPGHGKTGCSNKNDISVPKWERGQDIIPRARIAVDEINNSSDWLLSGYQLNIVEVNVIDCDVNTALVHYVESLVASRNVIGIVGYFCNNIADVFSSLIAPERSGYAIQVSASTDYLLGQSGSQHHFLPSMSTSAKGLVSFLTRLGWSKFGVLKTADYPGEYYSRLAETFSKLIGTDKIIYKSQVDYVNKLMNLTKLRYSGTKVVVGFLTPSDATKTICQAYIEGLTWPNYVWILVDCEINDLLHPTSACDEAMLQLAMNKVILIHHYPLFTSGDTVLPSGMSYWEYYRDKDYFTKSTNNDNNYGNVLYDTVWAFGIALNATLEKLISKNSSQCNLGWKNEVIINSIEDELSKLSFEGATGPVNFSQMAAVQASFGIFQFQEHEVKKLGLYSTSLNELTLNTTLLGTIPTDDLSRVYEIYPAFLTVILSLLIFFCILFTTSILILFFYFRAEPEIKAASRNLSLCMFLGCYTLLLASLDYTILSGVIIPKDNAAIQSLACVMDVTLSTIGLDLVLATLFAKTLRIYHIFKKFGKVKRLWSDNGLLGLIIIAVLIKVILLIVWTAVDINHVIDVKIYKQYALPPYYSIIQKCDCMYFGMWYALTFLYTGVLFIALLLVAIITRKIKRTNFKDTKKVNLLIATLLAVIVFSCTGWALLQVIDNNASKVIVSVGFALTSVLCQIFLLVPKIVPPIRRLFENTFVEPSTISTDTSYH